MGLGIYSVRDFTFRRIKLSHIPEEVDRALVQARKKSFGIELDLKAVKTIKQIGEEIKKLDKKLEELANE